MEKRVTVHNPTSMPIYVGSNMVPAGETIDFPESQVPPHLRPRHDEEVAAPAEKEQDLIADLQKLAVKEILIALPDLSAEDLSRLEALEHAAEKPRKSLEHAIAEEKLKRAAEKFEAGDSTAAPDGAGN